MTRHLALAALLALPTAALAAERPLFSAAATQADASGPEHGVMRSRAVRIDVGLLPGGSSQDPAPGSALLLNLFDDAVVRARLTSSDRIGRGRAWVGKVDGEPLADVVLTVLDGVVTGSVNSSQGLYRIATDRNGGQVVQELDPGAFPENDCFREPPGAHLPPAEAELTAAGDDGSLIDVLVVYTAAARAAAGSTAAMESMINTAITETNTGYANSGVVQRLRLAGAQEVSYTEDGTDMYYDLVAVSGGSIAGVQALRDSTGADTVSLIVNGYSAISCGIAWLGSGTMSAFAPNAYSVVERTCATGYYSFGHEIGHNMGLNHARVDPVGTGAYSYSFGYKWTGYRTVMAYAPGTRILYFSNPNVSYLGNATGISELAADSAYNALSLNNTRVAVANWRSSQPGVSINDVTVTEGNSGSTTATFTVSLSKASTETVTVSYSTANGTATTADSDYATASGILTFTAGTLTQPVSVTINGDTKYEANETYYVNLTSPANATLSDSQGLGTITNNDTAPTLSINDVTVTEGNSGATTTATFTVSLSAVSGVTATVSYGTANGTATTADLDYTSAGGSLTFTAGTTTQPVSVTVNGDARYEANETYYVNLSSASGATLSDNQGLGTITNNDTAPALSINDVTVTEGNSGTTTATFTVSLSAVSGLAATVNYATANGTATTADSDYASAGSTLTIAAGGTTGSVNVLVTGDTKVEANETFYVNLSSPANATLSDNQGLGTITNDDAVPTPLLTLTRTGLASGRVTSAPAGIDCGTACSAGFAESTVVTLTAAPAAGSTVVWGGACAGTGTLSCQVTMSAARTVTARFDTVLARLLMRRTTGEVRMLESVGTSFTTSNNWTSGFVSYRYDVYHADVDGDGQLDLVSRSKDTGNVEVFRSTGSSFAYTAGGGPGGVWSYGWGTSYDLYFADVTGDGKADLVGRLRSNGDVYVFVSTGSGFSGAAPSGRWSYGWSSGYDLYFTDATGDGKADIVSRYYGPTAGLTGNVYVGASSGSGFASPGLWTYGYSAGYDLYFADATGDGKADLVARYYGPTAGLTGDVYVMTSTGSGYNWGAGSSPWTYGWGSSYQLLLRDVTGDGKADMVGRHTGNGDIHVATSSGSSFSYAGTWATGVNTLFELR